VRRDGDVEVFLGGPLALGVRDVVGELRRDGTGFDDHDPDVGLQLDAQGLRPAVHPPLGRRVGGEAGRRDATSNRGDVHQVAAAIRAELVEEDLGDCHRAEQVGLDHAPVLLALVGREGRRQHDAGVVDEDIRAAEVPLHALGGSDDRLAVRDVGFDGDRAVAELVGKRLDAVRAAGEQRDPMAVGGQRAGGRLADAG
jgi:hypothetical protein